MMDQVIIRIAAAANMRALYPANHPRVISSIEHIGTSIAAETEAKEQDSLTFLIVGDDLVIGDDVIRKTTLSQRQFIQALKRRGIERLTIARGVTPAEMATLVEALAGISPIPPSSPNIILGQVHVGTDEAAKKDERREITSDDLDVVREAFAKFRATNTLPLGAMEHLVWGFIDSLSRTTRAMIPLAKLKEHDEYTFIHSVNVSLLVLAQARSFGIEGPMLHAFGMAGLLHDIGKLLVPLAVLNKPGKLEGEEWAEMQSHAERGAWYLAELDGTLPLAITCAYEHHMRYDGQAAYPVVKGGRIPHLASRMTSIADAFDAMMTVRPYQKPLLRSAAEEILTKRAGTFYDPLLTGNFVTIIRESTALNP